MQKSASNLSGTRVAGARPVTQVRSKPKGNLICVVEAILLSPTRGGCDAWLAASFCGVPTFNRPDLASAGLIFLPWATLMYVLVSGNDRVTGFEMGLGRFGCAGRCPRWRRRVWESEHVHVFPPEKHKTLEAFFNGRD